MTYLDIQHFSFTVSDIERSIAWYTAVLELELVHRQRQDNAYTRKVVGIDDAVLEVALFRVPGVPLRRSSHHLELIQYVGYDDRVPLETSTVGVAHMAFMVDDIHARYERLSARGVQFRNPPTAITEGANAGGYACYFADRDGITFELLQPAPSCGSR